MLDEMKQIWILSAISAFGLIILRIFSFILYANGLLVPALLFDLVVMIFLWLLIIYPNIFASLAAFAVIAAFKSKNATLEGIFTSGYAKISSILSGFQVYVWIVPSIILCVFLFSKIEIPFNQILAISIFGSFIGCVFWYNGTDGKTTLTFIGTLGLVAIIHIIVTKITLNPETVPQSVQDFIHKLWFIVDIALMIAFFAKDPKKIFMMFAPGNLLKGLFSLFILLVVGWVLFWMISSQEATTAIKKQATERLPEITLPTSKDTPKEVASKEKSNTEASVDESQWEKVGETKTCVMGWKTETSTDGWCSLGEFPAGEYRFETSGTMTKKDLLGNITDIPLDGWSIESVSDDQKFMEYVKAYYPIPTDHIWGLIVKKTTSNKAVLVSQGIILRDNEKLSLSINFMNMEINWTNFDFKGAIKIIALKKK